MRGAALICKAASGNTGAGGVTRTDVPGDAIWTAAMRPAALPDTGSRPRCIHFRSNAVDRKGVPATFVAPINEWYSWTPSPRANHDVTVLLTLDASNFPLGVKNTLNGGDIPVAWINSKYRMVYFNYGHGDQIYSTPVLPTMIDNSLRWLLSR